MQIAADRVEEKNAVGSIGHSPLHDRPNDQRCGSDTQQSPDVPKHLLPEGGASARPGEVSSADYADGDNES